MRGTPQMKRLPELGFVSGSSSHADRLATIRDVHRKHGRTIDTHTADGMKVARAYRNPDVPMLVLEIARPAKFEETIFEALGVKPPRPVHLVGIESLPKHFQVVLPSAEAVKRLFAEHRRQAGAWPLWLARAGDASTRADEHNRFTGGSCVIQPAAGDQRLDARRAAQEKYVCQSVA